MYKMFGNRKAICCTAIAMCIGLSGCTAVNPDENMVVVDQEVSSIAYEFALVEKGNVTKTEKIPCTYRQTNEQEVAFAISGKYIDKVYVKEGDTVKKGDLLAELSSEELERNIEDLQYAIKRNELLLEHAEVDEAYDLSGLWVNFIYFSGGTSEDEKNLNKNLDAVKRNYRYKNEDYQDALALDKQKLADYQRDLKASRLYASMDGVVYKLKNRLERSTSQKDEVIMHIVNTSECIFETTSPEAVKSIKEGELLEMSIVYGDAAGTYEVRPWHMSEWNEKQYFEVVDGPDNTGIEVGTSGSMKIIIAEKQNVPCVPMDAVHSADGKSFVYMMDEDGMREVVWVETGLVGDNMVELISGIAEGDKVIRR